MKPTTLPATMSSQAEAIRTDPDLASLSDGELVALLKRGLVMVADYFYQLARVWAEAERRKIDLSDLRHGLLQWVPLIARGELAAEIVATFGTRKQLLQAIVGVPLEEQRRLTLPGETVKVIDPTDPTATIDMPLADVPHNIYRVVFGGGKVRTPAQQRLAFRPRRPRKTEDDGERHYRPRYNREAGTVTVGRMSFPLADLLRELLAAAGPELPAIVHKEEYVTVKTRLTREEAERLVQSARNAELPDWELIRKALRAMGLI